LNQLINKLDTSRMMALVCVALIPGSVAEIYYLGWGILINLILCMGFALLAEAAVLKLRARPIKRHLLDYSAVITGWLIALAIPPLLPWWMSFIGVFFAIIIAKQLYGGLGFNPFNPAMVGYVLLLISFPIEMTSWLPSHEIAANSPSFSQSLAIIFNAHTSTGLSLQDFRMLSDGYTMATPLDESKTAFQMGLMTSEIIQDKHFELNSTSWTWINLAFLAGGISLVFNRIIQWQIPFSVLISMGFTATFLYLYDDQVYLSASNHWLLGATMLGAFFIATDPVTASTTNKGRLIYGSLIGFFIIIIRTFGGYPDAIAFSVLLINIAVPTIDHYTRPRTYGHQLPEERDV